MRYGYTAAKSASSVGATHRYATPCLATLRHAMPRLVSAVTHYSYAALLA